jgi:hypothetical protein
MQHTGLLIHTFRTWTMHFRYPFGYKRPTGAQQLTPSSRPCVGERRNSASHTPHNTAAELSKQRVFVYKLCWEHSEHPLVVKSIELLAARHQYANLPHIQCVTQHVWNVWVTKIMRQEACWMTHSGTQGPLMYRPIGGGWLLMQADIVSKERMVGWMTTCCGVSSTIHQWQHLHVVGPSLKEGSHRLDVCMLEWLH